MALTAEEENYIKDQKKIADLEKDIKNLNDTAVIAMNAKRAELTVIQDQLTTDVQTKQDAIDAIDNA